MPGDLLQRLERRRLLSGSFASVNAHGTLSIVGTRASDRISTSLVGGKLIANLNGDAITFDKAKVRRIFIAGARGSDVIRNDTSLPATLLGSNGDDKSMDLIDCWHSTKPISVNYFFTGEAPYFNPLSNTRITVGKSIDTLQGGRFAIRGTSGADSFHFSDTGNVYKAFGGAGDDTFIDDANSGPVQTTVWGESGNDLFFSGDFDDGENLYPFGGEGNDTFDSPAFRWNGGPGIDTSTIETLLAETIDMRNDPGVERLINVPLPVTSIIGNELSNYITLDELFGDNATISGGDGDDTIIAGGLNDVINGDAGNDVIHGGNGNDTLTGGGGRDKLFGDAGADLLLAKDGCTDTLDGGAGMDTAQRDNSATIKDVVLNIESFT
jgi:Ca2+-binding RTX toxin-like protein